jgi:hypothetical protein
VEQRVKKGFPTSKANVECSTFAFDFEMVRSRGGLKTP